MKLARLLGAGLALLLVGACDPPDISRGDDYDATVRRADEARQAGNPDTAIPLYERALQANPNGVEAKLGLGQSFLSVGAGDEAAAQFRDVLARRSGDNAARRGLAGALIAMGQPALAEQQIDAALRADAADYRALNLLGVALDLQGRHAEAQANYRRGIELAPDYVPLRSNFGLSLALTGPVPEAIAQLTPIAGSARADARTRLNLAFAYAMAGDLENSLQLCRRVLDERYAQRQFAYFMQLRALPPETRSAEFRRNPGLVAAGGSL
ncbi:MAG: tetratricopeptide repeat protein [Reyranella sp.]|uniref:tetratricopeptide repeat protein n=1 Tax=Reyranella sp. TaxID=1929291 RepID=UPI001AD4FC39|nr:tetratricopeptide repeat protein [Reyranella sp.]MBN9088971.1 tetratricopeptide repeat protein [Reyranella sp.]